MEYINRLKSQGKPDGAIVSKLIAQTEKRRLNRNERIFILDYIFDLEQHGGTYGGYVGKIDNLDQIANSASSKLSTTLTKNH